ncbi:putative inactive poly [Hordeum vulgare]|nr:putative inactive poly [Hordeum vulgare]KAI5014078.1 hypothetical protein ZWY2020_055468 [Hordeum vulgare]
MVWIDDHETCFFPVPESGRTQSRVTKLDDGASSEAKERYNESSDMVGFGGVNKVTHTAWQDGETWLKERSTTSEGRRGTTKACTLLPPQCPYIRLVQAFEFVVFDH